MCEQDGLIPEKSFKGTFNVRVGEDIHEQAVVIATERNISLNELVKTALVNEISSDAELRILRPSNKQRS